MTGRLLSVLIVASLVVGTFLLPAPSAPTPDADVGVNPPKFAVCLVEEGGGRTTEITVVSLDEGAARVSLYASGQTVGTMGMQLGALDTTVVPVVDITAVGTVVGLVELPSAFGAVSSLTRGVGTLAADTCVSTAPEENFITGGDTVGGNDFDLHLLNPFAVDAVVSLTVASDVGVESNPRFASIVIPARSSVVLEMRQLIPNREEISVFVEALQGRVVTVGRQSGQGQGATWSSLEPVIDWYLPLPPAGTPFEVLVANPSGNEIDFQVDVFAEGELLPAELFGIIAPNGQSRLNIDDELGARAVRVIASGPVTVTLRSDSPDGLAVTSGTNEAAFRWLVPGALEERQAPEPDEEEGTEEGEETPPGPIPPSGRLVVLNPGIEDANVVVRMLGGTMSQREFTVAAESVLEIEFGGGDAQLIEATAAVVVLWIAGPADAFAMGVALPDG